MKRTTISNMAKNSVLKMDSLHKNKEVKEKQQVL